MFSDHVAKTLLFCELNLAIMVNSFSSEKMIFPTFVPPFNWLKRSWALSLLFCFYKLVSSWHFLILYRDIFRSSLMMIFIDFSSIFISLAIPLIDDLKFFFILSLTALIFLTVRALQGLPHLGQSFDVLSSR